jgi:hypothetical protein
MHHPAERPSSATDVIGQARAYWERIRIGRTMPRREDLDPVDIPRLLPFVMLVDVRAEPLDFKFRLIGSAIQAIIARNYVGRWFSELPHMIKGNVVWAEYGAVVAQRRPVAAVVDYVGADRYVQGVRHCLMPLSNDDRAVNMIFAAVEIDRR